MKASAIDWQDLFLDLFSLVINIIEKGKLWRADVEETNAAV